MYSKNIENSSYREENDILERLVRLWAQYPNFADTRSLYLKLSAYICVR